MNKKASNEVRLIEDWRERWEPVTKHGCHVVAVADSEGEINVWANAPLGMTILSKGHLIPKPRPKTYRHWRREEVPVDEWFRNKANNRAYRIAAISDEGRFKLIGAWYTLEELHIYFALHRTTESGEWVPVEQYPKCGVEE